MAPSKIPPLCYEGISLALSDPSSPYDLVHNGNAPYFVSTPSQPTKECSPTSPQRGPSLIHWDSSSVLSSNISTGKQTQSQAIPSLPDVVQPVAIPQPNGKTLIAPTPFRRAIKNAGKANRLSIGCQRAAQSIEGKVLSPEDLIGQDHGFRSHCTALEANIRLLDFDVSAVELLTFFPQHTYWFGVAERLRRAGWSADRITKFYNWSRGYPTHEYVRRSTIHLHLANAKHWFWRNSYVATAKPSEMSNRSGGMHHNVDAIDYYLVDLDEGVQEHPVGSDALGLTRAIAYAKRQGHDQVKLSQARAYIEENGLYDLSQHYEVSAEDSRTVGRAMPMIKAYMMSVLDGRRN